ncbi:hypothetical protein CLHOM_31790 [Clostridium homopropionicum DSM 5847]|uniref:UPF0178 protein CLHOM_31790 n=1 Tax=Clostridium homopropionicum DSM 5847 TaxID=1121318 RepID=A0A0L6Z5P6_9CLOT|nr:YaiI/YqxD family protein [Clostridium homopropionicum]KOA18282.1 hypothetical protein CLHOM_31790 [Clostridium homopropionicum DSM 5847]SFF69861.1 hypothetical protein SAMN04488501_101305 [Clostridium homopropionicum]
MKIIVDADACPGREIIEKAAKDNAISVIMFTDINHNIISDYSEVRIVDKGFQSVDMKIANESKQGDIIVTQDYGVAAMVLGKKCYAISPKGYIYDNENIDRLLFERHLSAKARRVGKKTSNPKKRTEEDDKRLYRNILKLIEKRSNEDN